MREASVALISTSELGGVREAERLKGNKKEAEQIFTNKHHTSKATVSTEDMVQSNKETRKEGGKRRFVSQCRSWINKV
jgi:hypothetical protein